MITLTCCKKIFVEAYHLKKPHSSRSTRFASFLRLQLFQTWYSSILYWFQLFLYEMWNIVIPLHSLLSVFVVCKLLHFTEAKLGRNVHWIKITKFMFLFWLEIHHRNNKFHHRNKRSQGDMFSCTSVKCLFLLCFVFLCTVSLTRSSLVLAPF